MRVVFQNYDLTTHKVGHRRDLKTIFRNAKFRGTLLYMHGKKTSPKFSM